MSSRRTSAKAAATSMTLIALLAVPTTAAGITGQAAPTGHGGDPWVVTPAANGDPWVVTPAGQGA